jgi:hypothetical protein
MPYCAKACHTSAQRAVACALAPAAIESSMPLRMCSNAGVEGV